MSRKCLEKIPSILFILSVLHLLLATRNAHKTREFANILGPGYEIADLANADLPAVEETGSTFEENAVLKAVAVSLAFSGLVVADDSGLEVAALDGAPGVYSARYAGARATDEENVRKLLSELSARKLAHADRSARFCCALAVASNGKTLAVFQGELEGRIAQRPLGQEGFGYDPVFIPTGFDQSFGELGPGIKNRISHRAVAIKRLREQLLTEGEWSRPHR